MSSLALTFDILARDQASPAFRRVGDSAEKAGKQTSAFGSLTSKAMASAAGAIAGLALGRLFTGFIEDARESARVSRLTAQVIKTTGSAAHVTAQQVGDLATAISNKTGIDDEAVQSASNLLLTFTKVRNEVGRGNDVFNQATQIAIDMSTVLGTDASSAAVQLGKALNDPIKGITALSRAGVSFTEQQKDQIRTLVESGDILSAQKIILQELSTEFGGAAEAAADPLQRLGVIAGNLGEDVGSLLLPAVEDFARFAADDLIPAIRDAAEWFGDNLGPALGVAKDVFVAIVEAGGHVVDFFDSLPGPVQAATLAIGALVLLRGPASGLFDTLALKALYLKDSVTTATGSVGGFKGAMKGIASAFSPATLAVAGFGLLLPSIIEGIQSFTSSSSEAEAAQEGFAAALRETNGIIDDTSRAAAQRALIDADLVDVLDRAGVSARDAISGLLGNADAQERINQALQDYITTSIATEGRNNDNAAAARQARIDYEDLAATLGITAEEAEFFAGAVEGTAGTVADATAGAGDFQAAMDETQSALNDARAAVDAFKLSLDILTGETVDVLQVEGALFDALQQATDAMDDMSGAVLDSAGNLNTQTEAGNAAADVLFDVRNAGNQLIATMIEQGATTEEVIARDHELRESFIRSAQQMGISREAAEKLADQILGIPAERETQIEADTAEASRDVANFQSQIDNLHGKTVEIQANWANGGSLNGSMRFDFAKGGLVDFFANGGIENHIAQIAPAGAMRLWAEPETGGEAYIPLAPSKRARSMSIWEETGRRLGAFADGGLINVRADFNPVAEFARQAAGEVRKLLEPATGMVGALNWARTQVGKPYVWGSAGPYGYDCSGFMAAVTNVIRGRSPYARLGSTATMPWQGFAAGSTGNFVVGNSRNTGGGIGHMAGTLLGVNIESAGGVGVRVGGSARGAGSALFPEHYSFRYDNGGVIGEPVSGVGHRSGRSYLFGENGPETVTPGLPGGSIVVYAQFGEETIEARAVRVVDQALGQVADSVLYAGGS